jgi:hypothetical protein
MRAGLTFAASTFLVLLVCASDNGMQQIFCKAQGESGFAAVDRTSGAGFRTLSRFRNVRLICDARHKGASYSSPIKTTDELDNFLRSSKFSGSLYIGQRNVAISDASRGEDGKRNQSLSDTPQTKIGFDSDRERDARTPAKFVQSVLDYLEWRSGSKWRPLSQRWSEERWYYLDGFRALNKAFRDPSPDCACVYCKGAPFYSRKTITFAKVKGNARA